MLINTDLTSISMKLRKGDFLTICSNAVDQSFIAWVCVTAISKSREIDKVMGLKLGADNSGISIRS